MKITSHIRFTKNPWSPDPAYYTGVVVYWTHGRAWVFQRSYRTARDVNVWVAGKRAELTAHGPEPVQQAAE